MVVEQTIEGFIKEVIMIEFGPMKAIGFASLLDVDFDWGLGGLNVIRGANGNGKTKFINALYWCLYGKTLSGSVETWDFMRPPDYQGTMVRQEIDKDGTKLVIIRCKEYLGKIEGAKGKNRLVILEEGVEVGPRDKKDVQKYLDVILGYSADLFKNSIIFGQKLKRLISETGPNKKKIFEEAFEVVYLAKAKLLAEGDKNIAYDNYKDQLNIIESLSVKLVSLNSQLEREKELVNTFDNTKQDNIKREEKLITELEDRIKISENLLVNFNGISDRVIKAKSKVDDLKVEISKLKSENDLSREIGKFEQQNESWGKEKTKLIMEEINLKGSISNVPKLCSNCGKAYTIKERQEEKTRLQKVLDEITKSKLQKSNLISTNLGYIANSKELLSSLQTKKTKLESYKDKLVVLEEKEKTYLQITTDIESYRIEISNHRVTIKSIKGQVLKNNIEQYTRDLSTIEEEYLNGRRLLLKYHKALKITEWLINTPLSNKGLKAFIFNQMLDDVNERLTYYTQFIGFQVMFDIDMESSNKDLISYVYKGDKIVPYDDLSGGQQQTVDVVSAFAIHDVVNTGRECDLLIMDEVFESLDKNNIEIITELIQDKSQNKNIYLVTHLENFLPTNANFIDVDISDGLTSIS